MRPRVPVVIWGGGWEVQRYDEVLRCLEPTFQSAHHIRFAKTLPPDSKCHRSVIVFRNRADALLLLLDQLRP